MSVAARSISRTAVSGSRSAAQIRFSSTAPPPLTASLLLSRPPLLTPTPTPFESAFYFHSRSIAHALSSPLPLDFYFKTGSLPLRRHLVAEHAFVSETYGKKLSGKAPDVGDIPPETEYEIIERDRWEKADAKRGEKSLERKPEEEVYCLVLKGKGKEGKWMFPDVKVGKLEALDEAVTRGITGVEGSLGGKGMDSWLVTRKPVGMVKDGESRTFFIRGHILGGEPTLSSSSPYSSWAWLTAPEVEARLRQQGEGKLWDDVKGMFGIPKNEA
ncbi:hypothetical protein I305_00776 [Cryptococcus gattii E566]|uniref:Large ribosomal subunit protein mL46 N-terminal domain-containing protein n=2 Tax=Cryptococcus gattii TaxID=37769 RepID=E6R1U5_CRYGW|nr:uncharacterized protein CGB_C6690C [Cryptococcus gattii WM276]ADV21168.1 hypothetical protein CNC04580 [Cryptococcus gattii WM276]KIR81702.1 hypothetical protein I306_01012 [Cryptococcus gattii EJB2]KIY36727.1 hypothetical protein I305_00776 [Cryptococcus gattii E566]KJE01981.1 hypothetical protein I311_04341 [Cryptococcus gattii NT-10]